jgi:hypothetical protein
MQWGINERGNLIDPCVTKLGLGPNTSVVMLLLGGGLEMVQRGDGQGTLGRGRQIDCLMPTRVLW